MRGDMMSSVGSAVTWPRPSRNRNSPRHEMRIEPQARCGKAVAFALAEVVLEIGGLDVSGDGDAAVLPKPGGGGLEVAARQQLIVV